MTKPAHIGEVLISDFICRRIKSVSNRDNTEGSTAFSLKISADYYSLGLWLADGYWRTGSVGLTSISQELIKRFSNFLMRVRPDRQLKYQIYSTGKRKHTAICVYVNDSLLTNSLMSFKKKSLTIPRRFLPAYFAGRVDGDGHWDQKHRTGLRIAYGSEFDARRDLNLLLEYDDNPASLYEYTRAGTWVIYFRKVFLRKILPKLRAYSVKLLPRRD